MKKLLLVIAFLTTITGLFAQAPVITSFSPLKAPVGAAVTITGSNFDTVAVNNIVYFGSAKAVITAATSTSLTVTVPAGASYTSISALNTTSHLTAQSSSKFTATFAKTTAFSKNQFTPVVHIAVDETSRSLAFGDLNGDNKPELIVPGKNGLVIYCNTSTGPFSKSSFTKQVTLPSNVEVRSTITADMDNDGKPDIITANNTDNSISIYFNKVIGNNITSGSFLKVTIPYGTVNETPYGLATGDIDSDGKLDLLVQNNNNTISIFKNIYIHGSGQPPFFAPRINLTVSNGLGGNPAIDDLNGDGKPELIIPRSTGNLLVFVNKTQNGVINYSSFEDYKTFTSRVTQNVSIGDIDGDNMPDIVTGIGSTTYVSRNLSTPGGEINLAARVGFTGGLLTTLADFDGDGKVDVASVDHNNSDVFVTRNKTVQGTIETPSFDESIVLESGDSPTGIYNSDVNGDGKPDVAVLDLSRSEVIIFINDYNPVPPVITAFSPLHGAKDTTITITGNNFSNNINDNIVYFGAVKASVTSATANQLMVKVPAGATYGAISVLNRNTDFAAVSNQAFTPVFPSKYQITKTDIAAKIDLPAGSQPYGVAIGDLDGDGKSDFVVANSVSGSISLYHNAYVATNLIANPFPKTDIRVGNGPACVIISDINNDGKPDIIVANYASNTISVLRNTSVAGTLNSTSFAAKVDLITLQNPASIKITDVDGDGWPDLLIANSGTNSISVIRNAGNTENITNASFAQRVDFVVGGNPASITTSDINGDGKPDVIATNYSDNTIAVLRNTSTKGVISAASFAPKMVFATAKNPISVLCADVNGDNHPDIIVANKGSNSLSLFTNNTPTDSIPVQSILLSPKIDYPTGAQPNCVAAGDIDGDGLVDIVSANAGSNTISVLRNGKDTLLPKIDFATGKSPAGVSIADLSDDGKADILVTNKIGNSISAFRNAPDMRPPVIASFSPGAGPAGTTVTITGKDFNADAVNNIVYFGGTRAEVITAGLTQLMVKVPASAMAQPISVTDTTKKLTGYSPKSFKPTFAASNFNLAKAYEAPMSNFSEHVTVADLNGDGKPDIISSAGDVIENNIAGPDSSQHLVIKPGLLKQSVGKPVVADLNGDGKLDIVTAPAFELQVSENISGGGSISTASFFHHTYSNYFFSDDTTPNIEGVCDIDLDGRPDIITLNPAAKLFSVHKNTGQQGIINAETFANRTDIITGNNLIPEYLKIGDIDGDGKPDIVIFNNNATTTSPGSIAIYRNKTVPGVPTTDFFETKVEIPVPSANGELIDVNGNGKLDIVFGRPASGSAIRTVLAILINISNKGSITQSSFMPEMAFNLNRAFDTFSFKDVTGNGKYDMLLPMGDITIFQNLFDTRSIANPVILKKTTEDYWSVEVCDLDGDGRPDLLGTGTNLEKVIIYKNISDTVNTTANLQVNQIGAQSTISLYPNPSVSYSNLEYNLTAQSDVAVKVFDKNGRTVRSYDLKKQAKGINRLVVQTGDLDKGIYIITLSVNGQKETVKLLKE